MISDKLSKFITSKLLFKIGFSLLIFQLKIYSIKISKLVNDASLLNSLIGLIVVISLDLKNKMNVSSYTKYISKLSKEVRVLSSPIGFMFFI